MKMSSFSNPLFMKAWTKIFSVDKELSPRLAYHSDLLNEYLVSQNKKFLELRDNIIKTYGTKDEKGELIVKDGNISFKAENLNDVNKAFAELMQVDLEPDVPKKLKLDDLIADGIKLTGPDVGLLKDLLDLGDEAPKATLSVVPPLSN